MAQKIDQGMIMTALDYCYDKAINGLPGVDTAEELAQEYMAGEGNLKSKAESLVRWQIAKAGTSREFRGQFI